MNRPCIAIIDSGLYPAHPHVLGATDGIAFVMEKRGPVRSTDYSDRIGHGTAIAGLIRLYAPDACLFAVKIFHERLEVRFPVLSAALEWAIAGSFDLIHLSLGTYVPEYGDPLRALCKAAHQKDIPMIASARGPNDQVYPAAFPTVIGVYAHAGCPPNALFHDPDATVEFGAHGHPRPLPGLPQERNFRGASFAAAHVTGMAAQMMAETDQRGIAAVREKLSLSAVRMRPENRETAKAMDQ